MIVTITITINLIRLLIITIIMLLSLVSVVVACIINSMRSSGHMPHLVLLVNNGLSYIYIYIYTHIYTHTN